jgi:dihydrofolate reductase
MGRIVVSENISLDGVTEDPTGEAGFVNGGWFGQITDEDRAAWAAVELEEALASEVMLLGRRSYEYFEARWPSRTGEWADRLNSMPKYVVSSTLENPGWNNTKVLTGDVLGEIANLKESVAGDVVVYASGQLVPSLIEHHLVDELRLMVYPFLLGGSHSLFRELSDQNPLRIVDARRVGESLALLTYELIRHA